jgi:hypothetical protein
VRTQFPLIAIVLMGLVTAACGSEMSIAPDASMHDASGGSDAANDFDAGPLDGGSRDAGLPDASPDIDAGMMADAGTMTDAGTMADAGTMTDAGTMADAGTMTDAGTMADAGMMTDAGMMADAGTMTDAGTMADAGMMADAGTMADAGPPPPPTPIDCENDPISSFAGVVQALNGSGPIAGVRVCVLDHPEIPCATTSAAGYYELACAPVGEAAISFESTEYSTGVWLWNGEVNVTHALSVLLETPEGNTIYFASTGVAYPDGMSGLLTMTFTGNAGGLTARLRSGEGRGPFYTINEGGQLSPTATELESASEFAFFIARPAPGWNEIEVELNPGAGIVCGHPDGIWQARDATPNVIRMPIQTGSETVVSVRCQ